ncbi:MAG: protein translocase subunit SecF [Holosporales bacterium]|nr:protein translocase subunit SecF [Holosporales bacterium]
MALFRLPTHTKIPFLSWRYFSFSLSAIAMGITFLFLGLKGLNYGVDFKGGVSVEVRVEGPVDLALMRTKLLSVLQADLSIQEFGSPQDLLIRVEQTETQTQTSKAPKNGHKDADEVETSGAQILLNKIQQALGQGVEYRRVETIGPKIGRELVRNGLIAVFWSLVAMFVYIWCRFEWRFGIAAFGALIQDCIWVLGLFTVFRMEFNETAIVAFLITASYSINDTVVIFDRIRENRQKYKKMPFGEMVNLSINETLSRTILTSCTTLLALAVLYFLGGPIIASFSFPIFVGIVVGTYSSIFIAPPLLLLFQKRGSSSVLANKNAPS